ncbi:MAG: TIR domain-containing protein [Anaerolineae bacterium]|nr:TIR domain-containing protein [Anaerolineae bacterium]
MMTRRLIKISFVFVLLCFVLPSNASAQEECDVLFSHIDPASISTQIEEWHHRNVCGQGIRVAILSNAYPVQEAVSGLVDVGLLNVPPIAESNWTRENSSERDSEVIQTFHAVAPGAEIYFYRIARLSDFDEALGWSRSNNVKIVANLVTLIGTPEEDVQELVNAMNSASEDGILWLNTAGNYGNSFIEASFDSTGWDLESWHYFSEDGQGYLPIQRIDPNRNVIVYVSWKDPDTDYLPVIFNGIEPLVEADIPPEAYTTDMDRRLTRLSFTPSQDDLFVGLLDRNAQRQDAVDHQFRMFLVNAAITANINISGNSIPYPNDNPNTLTIGSIASDTKLLRSSEASALGKPEIRTMGQSPIPGSHEDGTAFATVIVAGSAAIYWSHNANATVPTITDELIASSPNTVFSLRNPPVSPLPVVGGISFLVVMVASVFAYRVYDRQRVLRETQSLQYKAVPLDGKRKFRISFDLPIRSNGYPKLGRYFQHLIVKINVVPPPKQIESVDTSLPNWNVGRSVGVEYSLRGFTITKDGNYERPVVSVMRTSSETVELDIFLKVKYGLRPQINVTLNNVVWDDIPENIQFRIEMSIRRQVLVLSEVPLNTSSEAKAPSGSHMEEPPVPKDVDARKKRRTIFVSYSSHDRTFVIEMLDQLRSVSPCDFWIDIEQIEPGSAFWHREIQAGLDKAEAMMLIVSPRSMRSDEVEREWTYFLSKERLILPIVYEKAELNYRLRPAQYIVVNSGNLDEKVLGQISKVLNCANDVED